MNEQGLGLARDKIIALLRWKTAAANMRGPGIVECLGLLSRNLNRIFPPGSNSLNYSRAQYKEANACLAEFMKVSGFRSVVGAFRALYRDFDELDLGNVPGIFKPKSFNCGHVDQSRVCSARAIVAIALDEAVADKKMQVNRASEKIASQRGKLRAILASRSKILQP